MKQPKCTFLFSGGDFNNLLSGRHRWGKEPRRLTRGTVDSNRSKRGERKRDRTTLHPEGGSIRTTSRCVPQWAHSTHFIRQLTGSGREGRGNEGRGRAGKTTRGRKKKRERERERESSGDVRPIKLCSGAELAPALLRSPQTGSRLAGCSVT